MASSKQEHTKVNPYPNVLLFLLDEICLLMLRVYRLPLDEFLSSFVPTTEECKRKNLWIIKRLVLGPFLLLAVIITLPIGIVGFIIWLTFQHRKTPYRLSIARKANSFELANQDKDIFSFATVNLCLLPGCATRFNNQTDPAGRSKKQGERIAQQQLHVHSLLRKNINSYNVQMDTTPVANQSPKNGILKDSLPEIDVAVLEQFPPLDILLVQVGNCLSFFNFSILLGCCLSFKTFPLF